MLTPFEQLSQHPFNRPRSLIERIFDRAGINRLFLREGKRPQVRVQENILVSPVEGKLIEIQTLSSSSKIRGKKHLGRIEWYSFEDLVYTPDEQQIFDKGLAFNFYLCPLNLHYLLFPTRLTVLDIAYHPGVCRPIAFMKSGEIRNERLVLSTETASGVPMIIVLIASFLVSGIECVADIGKTYMAGELLGGFKMGSTVMLLFPHNAVESLVEPGSKIMLNEPFAQFHS